MLIINCESRPVLSQEEIWDQYVIQLEVQYQDKFENGPQSQRTCLLDCLTGYDPQNDSLCMFITVCITRTTTDTSSFVLHCGVHSGWGGRRIKTTGLELTLWLSFLTLKGLVRIMNSISACRSGKRRKTVLNIRRCCLQQLICCVVSRLSASEDGTLQIYVLHLLSVFWRLCYLTDAKICKLSEIKNSGEISGAAWLLGFLYSTQHMVT